jgi:hypothetical protein
VSALAAAITYVSQRDLPVGIHFTLGMQRTPNVEPGSVRIVIQVPEDRTVLRMREDAGGPR